MTTLQLDMFAAASAPALPVARVHPHNPRAYDVSDCHREEIDCGHGCAITVLVARCADGLFRCSAGYTSSTMGRGGPVFVSDPAAETFGEARALALLELAARMRISYGAASDVNRARFANKLKDIPLEFCHSPA